MEPGDKVHIVAPSSAGSSSNLPRISDYVTSLGYVPHIADGIYDSSEEPLYANTDDFRARDFAQACVDDSKLIWCIRGGAGGARLLDYLDRTLPTNLPQKLFVGFSDATFLHSYLQRRFGWKTIHGVMLEQIVQGSVTPESIDILLDMMVNPNATLELNNVTQFQNGIEMEGGSLTAPIVGGNLTLVETSLGTSWEIDAAGKILFVEDVGEAAYRTERSLDHVKQSGILKDAKGVIFGDFTGVDSPSNLEIVKQRFAKSVPFPVFSLEGIGHASSNRPLPLNTEAVIEMYDTGARLCSLSVKNVYD